MTNLVANKISKAYLAAALKGDRRTACETIDSALSLGMNLPTIYTEVLCRAQGVLGEKWSKGEINIAEEHLVSNITMEQMGRLREKISPKKSQPYRLVITTLPGDDHTLGARMVGDFFLMEGWAVEFLGRSTPTEDLIAFIRSREPDLVALSISVDSIISSVPLAVSRIKTAFPNLPIIAGGLALHRSTKEELGVDALVSSPEHAVQEAFRLLSAETHRHSLEEILSGVGDNIRLLRRQKNLHQKELGDSACLRSIGRVVLLTIW